MTNYNVLLSTDDMLLARQIAWEVSERGGGLFFVQAMALAHEEGKELLLVASRHSTFRLILGKSALTSDRISFWENAGSFSDPPSTIL